MKKHRILVSLALAMTLLCGTALAANTIKTQMIEANYMGIRVVIDGLEVTPKDATGHTVEPFTSNGTTYLPVRAVAEALGKDVEWDGENRIVYIGDNIPGKETNWMTKLPPYQLSAAAAYDGSDHESYFTVAGVKQTWGVVMQSQAFYTKRTDDGEYARGTDLYSRYGVSNYDSSALWNTNNQYKTMNITIGHMGDAQVDCKLEVYLDGIYSTTYDLPWDAAPKTLAIPLNYAPNVKLQLVSSDIHSSYISYDGAFSQYGIYNISFSE